MDKADELKMLYGAYYGVSEMDSYKTKEFVLSKINNHINEFIKVNRIDNYEEIRLMAYNQDLITKLYDSLYILKNINESMELILMIKERVSQLKHKK